MVFEEDDYILLRFSLFNPFGTPLLTSFIYLKTSPPMAGGNRADS